MKKSKQLFIVHLLNDFSGSPRVLKDLIDSSLTEPCHTYLFTSQHQGFLSGVNCKLIPVFYDRSANRYFQLICFLTSQIYLFCILSAYLIKNRISGIQTTLLINTMLPFGAGLAGKLLADKVIYYVHESYVRPVLLKRFLRFVVELSSNFVIFVSNYLKENESFSRPHQVVIYNGLRSDFTLIEPISLEEKYKGKKILFASSLKEYKGTEQFISLAKALPDFNFHAAVNCTTLELDHFIKSNKIPGNMVITIRPPELKRLFLDSYLVVNLSLPDQCVETFGLSLLEGMALGSPVVAPPVGGPVEFVSSANGLKIDSRETQAIVDFVRSIDGSFQRWKMLSEQAFETSKRFSSENYKKNIRNFFFDHGLV